MAFSSRRRLSCRAMKEGRARLAPALLCIGIFRRDSAAQYAGEHLCIEPIGAGGTYEFAELATAAFLGGIGFCFKRLQFRLHLAGFPKCQFSIGKTRSAAGWEKRCP